ncbi:MAG TPA: hypothetical protein VJP79_09535 [Nitrososphaera sp.]|nr:hypothetical protein [Nitrososphaera sp.]
MFRCPDCGNDMRKRFLVTRLGDVDGWACHDCDAFYEAKAVKRAILTV